MIEVTRYKLSFDAYVRESEELSVGINRVSDPEGEWVSYRDHCAKVRELESDAVKSVEFRGRTENNQPLRTITIRKDVRSTRIWIDGVDWEDWLEKQ